VVGVAGAAIPLYICFLLALCDQSDPEESYVRGKFIY